MRVNMYITGMNYFYITFAVFLCLHQFLSSAENSIPNNATPDYLESLLNRKAYKEFINILQIPNTDLVNTSEIKSSYNESAFYNGLELGDILLRPGQVLNPEQESDFNGILKLSINKWKNGTVPYYISNTFSDNQTNFIQNKINYYNKELGPNINFRPYQSSDNDYLLYFKGGSGCYTNLGNVGGPQVISLTEPCFLTGFVEHEMQHVLGIAHEHNRMDRDDYIHINTGNISQYLKPQYVKYDSENSVNIGPFDYYSVNMFPVKTPGFDINAFELYQDGIDVGAELALSPTDIQRVKILYS